MDLRDEYVETSLIPGQPWQQCPEGSYEKGTVTETLERGDTVVLMKNVPALVCDVCGNSLLATEEVKRLQSILEQVEAQGVELQSRRYQPMQEATERKTASTGEDESGPY